jgi:hypothetical protein
VRRIPPRRAGACNTFKEPAGGLWGILNKDRNDNRQCKNNERNTNVNSSNSEDGDDNVNGGGSRERLDKRQQGRKGNKSDCPGKVTRGSKRGESGNPGTRMMRLRNKE